MSTTNPTTLHIAYDNRAVDVAFASVFGEAAAKSVQPKTTKTYCDKRVAFSLAVTSDAANCLGCLTAHQREQAENATLLADMIATWPAGMPLPGFLKST